MRYAVGADHAGITLKQAVIEHLRALGEEVLDVGTHGSASVDYPDFAAAVARAVSSGEADRGVLVCGTGIGMMLAANKVRGVRAAVVGDTFSAEMAVRHNNAQILCLGERVVGVGLGLAIVSSFHSATFEGGRHQRRLDKIAALESEG